jgi:hypothetical protein
MGEFTDVLWVDGIPQNPPPVGYPCWCFFPDYKGIFVGVWSDSVELPNGKFDYGFIDIELDGLYFDKRTSKWYWNYTDSFDGIPLYDYRVKVERYKLIDPPFSLDQPN